MLWAGACFCSGFVAPNVKVPLLLPAVVAGAAVAAAPTIPKPPNEAELLL